MPTFLIYDNTTLAHSKLILIPLSIIHRDILQLLKFEKRRGVPRKVWAVENFSKSDKWGMLIMHRYILKWKFEDFCIKFLQKCLPIKGVTVNGQFLWLQRSMNKMVIITVTLMLI